MKKQLFVAGMIGVALTFGLVLAGCDNLLDALGAKSEENSSTYRVSYDLGGGGGTPPAERTVASGTSILLPGEGSMTAPDGKEFDGWETGGTTYAVGDSYTVNSDVTFVAQWKNVSGGGGGGPSAPTGVTATALSLSSISVSWNSVSGATSYDVYYEIGSSTTKNFAANVTGTAYTHTGLQPNTTYYYYIKAKNSAGESGYSSFTSSCGATTSSSSGGGSAPSAPTGVTATAQSSSTVSVSWNAVSGATSYKVYYATSSSGSYQLDGTSNTTSYTSSGWSSLSYAYFKVTAVNSAGESAHSSVASAALSGGGSQWPPTNITATFTSTDQVHDNSLSSTSDVKWYKISFSSFANIKIMGVDRQAGSGNTADIVATVYNSTGSIWKSQTNIR